MRTQRGTEFAGHVALGCQGVQVHDGFAVAVQVKHHIGVDGQLQQTVLQVFGAAARTQRSSGTTQRSAHHHRVVLQVRRQLVAHRGRQGDGEIGERAVEVAAVAQVESTMVLAEYLLGQPDRVGKRYQYHFAQYLPASLQRFEARA